jgi:hypothetical protein
MNTVKTERRSDIWRSWYRRIRISRVSTAERALIAAHGRALAVLATTLQGSGHLDARRFAEMLSVFGVVVSEDDDLQGAILAMWADTMSQSVDAITGVGERP